MPLRIISIIALAVVAVAACSDDDTPSGPDNGAEVIMPLKTGNYWIFERTRTEQSSVGIFSDTLWVFNTTDAGGNSWYPVSSMDPANRQLFRNTAQGLMVYAKETESLYLPYPAQKGDSTVAVTGEGTITVFVTDTEEVVETPAGAFTCYRYYWEEHTGAEYTMYYAPNTGPVRFEYAFEFTSPQYPDGYSISEVSVLTEYLLKE